MLVYDVEAVQPFIGTEPSGTDSIFSLNDNTMSFLASNSSCESPLT